MKRTSNATGLPALLASCVLLPGASACSGSGATLKAADVVLSVMGLQKPAGPPPPREAGLHIVGGKNLNADPQGRPLSAVLRIYKLKDAANFVSAPYTSFQRPERERDALGADLLEVREVTLAPGQVLDLKEKMPPDATHLGVVALFRAPHPQRWRFAFAQGAVEKTAANIGVHACAMTVTNIAPLGGSLPEASLLTPAACE